VDIYQGWNIATEGNSGWFCKTCGYSLSWEDAEQVGRENYKCKFCNQKIVFKSLGLKVIEEDVKFFDINNVYNTSWYHASQKDNWLENILSYNNPSVVHLGSKNTALSRKKDYDNSNHLLDNSVEGSDWFLYEVKILPSASISKRVWEDVDKDFPRNVDELLESKYLFDIIRYVNFWERPGSISLLANPNFIKVVNKKIL
jgi:DNA-directed RNA polymerase subunit RPC12/RpoP